ncbi:uncharacterized protein LOC114971709 [Acropora millepora]|uniref:uncharacterized protein LOC114971709 n=1 Tax=Acropora millepora TaxID=45264 RepID=UPI001CF4D23D|nr:uncharacterized protein LOC114971709 [Acropora millepora]
MYPAKFSLSLLFGICCLTSVSQSVDQASALSSSVRSKGREVRPHEDKARTANSSPEFSLGKRSYGCPQVYGFEYARDFFQDTAAGPQVYRYHPERVDTVTCHSSCGTSCHEVRVRMWVTRIHKYECFNSQTSSKEVPVKCVCM